MEIIIYVGRDKFVLDEKYRVIEYSNGLNKRNASEEAKETWRITGAWYKGAFGRPHIISMETLLEKAKNKELFYKNGQPKYALMDIDHNTNRLQGKFGVEYISITE